MQELVKLAYRLQVIVLESKFIAILAIEQVKRNKGSATSGVDGISFKSVSREIEAEKKRLLKTTKYGMSKKRISCRRELPKIVEISPEREEEIEMEVKAHNDGVLKDL